MVTRALIIGAPRSGTGKTSITIGLLRAFARRGIRVRGVKTGPDYIDPGFHAAATGRMGVNIESWAMQPALVNHLLEDAAQDCDLLLIESAMGLFDGIPSEKNRSGAAADLARIAHIPVLLVLDVSGQSQTVAAIACGFARYDPEVHMAGVVLNRAGSERHIRLAGDAIKAFGLPLLGAVPRNSALSLPERHLGLVQASEHPALDPYIDQLADTVEATLDLDAIYQAAVPLQLGQGSSDKLPPPPGQRIALAEDAAFSFLYPHLRKFWRDSGAELISFAPLADQAPDPSCDVVWLPGGYPELHAAQLAAAANFRSGMAHFAQTKPVHGECGGYMVLGQSLTDAEGHSHAMLDLLSHHTSFAKRKMNLGYRQARLAADCLLGPAGSQIRGHEFHYASVIDQGHDQPFAEIADGEGRPIGMTGGRRNQVTGAFFHLIARA